MHQQKCVLRHHTLVRRLKQRDGHAHGVAEHLDRDLVPKLAEFVDVIVHAESSVPASPRRGEQDGDVTLRVASVEDAQSLNGLVCGLIGNLASEGEDVVLGGRVRRDVVLTSKLGHLQLSVVAFKVGVSGLCAKKVETCFAEFVNRTHDVLSGSYAAVIGGLVSPLQSHYWLSTFGLVGVGRGRGFGHTLGSESCSSSPLMPRCSSRDQRCS